MTNEATATIPDPRPPAAPGLWFEQAADRLVRGGIALGVVRALHLLAAGRSGWSDPALILDAAYVGVLHAVAGLALATPVRAVGAWLDLRARQGAARIGVIEHPSVAVVPSAPAYEPVAVPAAVDPLAEIRRLIHEGEWEAADQRAREVAAERADDPGVAAVVAELEHARREAGDRWRGQLQAAREVNDPTRVLELYEEAPRVLDDEARYELDRDLAKWFLDHVHRRLRSGILQMDVVSLVDRVSETFGHTKEGASLRAALPTLRRGAGLCGRCGKPYTGFASACPECLGAPEPPPPFIPELEPVDEIETVATDDAEPSWFLDPDEGPNANGRPPS
ncbi:hypothetical protein [Paludisphaera mucosa]|uniref:Zinc ribbon domain-containing protein n=1 Tax=Paludisphaera mucosa TaxID=3030827 RepID=A0ABT6FFX6_9BACT|nr:hypothetical protein [Paludisphaera mucosa]MDG3006473.1 hypothetical protein [Paludisphaera mucosa]